MTEANVLEATARQLARDLTQLPRESLGTIGSALCLGARQFDALAYLGRGMRYLAEAADPDGSLVQMQLRGMLRDAGEQGLCERLDGVDDPPWPAVVRAIKAASVNPAPIVLTIAGGNHSADISHGA